MSSKQKGLREIILRVWWLGNSANGVNDMSEFKHTPGPWWIDQIDIADAHILGAPDRFATCDIVGTIDTTFDSGVANAARIVACVNACEGIANLDAIGDVVEAAKAVADIEFFGGDELFEDGDLVMVSVGTVRAIRAALAKLDTKS